MHIAGSSIPILRLAYATDVLLEVTPRQHGLGVFSNANPIPVPPMSDSLYL